MTCSWRAEETIADTARVISRYVDAVMIRLLDHEMVEELAAHATIPVINGLTKWSHPAQVMADVMTFEEHRGPIQGATVAWSGDSNNVLTSWIHAAKKFDFTLRIAAPKELPPDPEIRQWARGGKIEFGHDPQAAVKDADCSDFRRLGFDGRRQCHQAATICSGRSRSMGR